MLEELRKITKEKYEIDTIRNSWCEGSITYFENIKGELSELEY